MTPAGENNAAELRARLRGRMAQLCILRGEFRLSSGGTSGVYFDCKRATMDGDFLNATAAWVAAEVLPKLPEAPDFVGGPTLGAVPIAAAIAMHSARNGQAPAVGLIVRNEPKAHGTRTMIENDPDGASRVLVVEDVITTGGSVVRACDALVAAGHSVAGIFALLDREAGGREALENKYGAPVFPLFKLSDFPEATGDAQ